MIKQLVFAAVGIFMLPLVALHGGGPQYSVGTAAQGSYLPSLPYDFSDLDVRDNRNQLVQSAIADHSFAELLIGNLFNLTVQMESHGMRDLWDGIYYISDLLHRTFFTSIVAAMVAIFEAIESRQKRIVHNVHNLWTTPIVGVAMGMMAFCFVRHRSACLSVVLRC